MTPTNFAIWCLQITLIVALGAALPRFFRLISPRLRLAYWHVLLLICLTLPLVQPYRIAPVQARGKVAVTTGPMVIKEESRGGWPDWTWEEAGATLLACGIAVRLTFLGAGMVRLRRLRHGAAPAAALETEISRGIRQTGATASFFLSDHVTGPVTFGLRRPVVLLPSGFLDLSPEKRMPVLCHELLHVSRSDWAFAVAEEFIRAILWFHPAIWWLLGRIHLTREQAVDQDVIRCTEAKDDYVQALLAIAGARMEADLAPAPLFLRTHHLRERVAFIIEGVTMPKRSRILASFAVFTLLPLIVGVTAWQFPLRATPQDVVDGPGIEVVSGGSQILHRPGVTYPADALAKRISGDVTIAVNLSSSGEPIDAHVLSGPSELRKGALQSVLNWHFAPSEQKTVDVVIHYSADKMAPPSKPFAGAGPIERKPYPVDSIDLSALPTSLKARVAGANLLQPGELLTQDRFQQVEQSLRGIDDHLRMQGSIRDDKMTVRIALNGGQAPSRIKVGGNAQSANIITKVTPLYPREAKEARIQGTVRMEVTIDREGHVMDIQLVSGDPALVASAMTAVKQWVYRPTLLNGNPVEVTTMVDVNYTLTQ